MYVVTLFIDIYIYAIVHTVHKVCNGGAGIYSSVMAINQLRYHKPTINHHFG
jgi:hypothetical protein